MGMHDGENIDPRVAFVIDRFVENESIHTRDPFSTSRVCASTRLGLPHAKALAVWLTVHCNYVMGPIAQPRGCAGDYCTEKSLIVSLCLSLSFLRNNLPELFSFGRFDYFFCRMFR